MAIVAEGTRARLTLDVQCGQGFYVRSLAHDLGAALGGGAVAGAAGLNFLALLLGGKESWERLAQVVLLAHLPVVLLEGAVLGVLVMVIEH